MATLYKLTTQDNYTRNGENNQTLWGENFTISVTPKNNPVMCSSDVIHAYVDPRLAVILNPIHANIDNPKLWESEGEVVVSEKQLKVGCFTLTTVKEILLPEISVEQKIAFAILCAKEVYQDPAWNAWADKWLSGENRSKEAAYYAARAAAYAASAAAYAASAAKAASAAAYAASAAKAASAAAYADAYATKKDIDLIKILDYVMERY